MRLIKRIAAALLAVLLAGAFVGCTFSDSSVSSSLVPASSAVVSSFSAEPGLAPIDTTNINPLTGGPRPEGMAPDARPAAVMVANNDAALPQRGLAEADVVYETLCEGGITRLMAMYADYRTVPAVGPVRSTRDQFIQLALPSDAILAHIGSSVYGRNLLDLLSYLTVDGILLGSTSFAYDAGRQKPNEYSWYTDAGLIWAGMEYIDINPLGNTPALFRFLPQQTEPEAEISGFAVYMNYSPQSTSAFVYSPEARQYLKYRNGTHHMLEGDQYFLFTNVMVLLCEVGLKPDGRIPQFNMEGGTGYYFSLGSVREITWEKGSPTAPLRLFGEDGQEIDVQPGKSYVGMIPTVQAESVHFYSKEEWDANNAPAA